MRIADCSASCQEVLKERLTGTAPHFGKENVMRKASFERNTNETQITVSVNIDGSGKADISTGIGFLDHMLEQVARHDYFERPLSRRRSRK